MKSGQDRRRLHDSPLDDIERLLRERHAKLTQSRAEIVAQQRAEAAERSPDAGLSASQTLHGELQAALVDRQNHQLAAVEAALERLARGEYGICGDCGGLIGTGRLRVLPFAQRCTACESRDDSRVERHARSVTG
jgi:RNA polymerase-binding transcription factor